MNHRIISGFLLVFIITVFTQCTVQKRLYRQGWHVEFRQRKLSVQEDVPEGTLNAMTAPVKSQDKAAMDSPEEITTPTALPDSALVTDSEFSQAISPVPESISERFSATTVSESTVPVKSAKDQKRPYDQADKNTKITVFLVLLLLFLMLIILMLFGLSLSISVLSYIGIILLLILTIPIAFALLIILLVAWLSPTTEQLAEEKRLEAEEKKRQDEMTPEEQEAYRAANASKGRKQKADNIAAAIIAVAIVLLAIFVLSDKQ